jgi:hypothetical protein
MINRRDLLLLAGAFAVTACGRRPAEVEPVNQPKPGLTTVTLAISGMT